MENKIRYEVSISDPDGENQVDILVTYDLNKARERKEQAQAVVDTNCLVEIMGWEEDEKGNDIGTHLIS